jgi:hypothetical protein
MPKFNKEKKQKNYNIALYQPDELNELKRTVLEYVNRRTSIENEIETLKEDKKALREEFEEKLDLKTLELVEKHLRIRRGVAHKDTFDTFLALLQDPAEEQ